MSRFTMALVAAAAAAIAAIAVVALPAIGDDSGGSPPRVQTPDFDKFVGCLRTHGLPDAPSDPIALKPWLATKQASDPQTVEAAVDACNGELPSKRGVAVAGPDMKDMIACVRKHGLDAPSDPVAFKRWVASQEASDPDRLDAALRACKAALDPGAGKPPADCGAAPPAAEAKPEEAAPTTRGV